MGAAPSPGGRAPAAGMSAAGGTGMHGASRGAPRARERVSAKGEGNAGKGRRRGAGRGPSAAPGGPTDTTRLCVAARPTAERVWASPPLRRGPTPPASPRPCLPVLSSSPAPRLRPTPRSHRSSGRWAESQAQKTLQAPRGLTNLLPRPVSAAPSQEARSPLPGGSACHAVSSPPLSGQPGSELLPQATGHDQRPAHRPQRQGPGRPGLHLAPAGSLCAVGSPADSC